MLIDLSVLVKFVAVIEWNAESLMYEIVSDWRRLRFAAYGASCGGSVNQTLECKADMSNWTKRVARKRRVECRHGTRLKSESIRL